MNNVPPKGLYRFLGRWDDFDIAFISFVDDYCCSIDLKKLKKKFITSTSIDFLKKFPEIGPVFEGKNENIETNVPLYFYFLYFGEIPH